MADLVEIWVNPFSKQSLSSLIMDTVLSCRTLRRLSALVPRISASTA